MSKIERVKSISEFHRVKGLPEPEHPLISVVNYADLQADDTIGDTSWVYDFYTISIKRNINGKIYYGQQEYDFDEGVMFFIAPGQVLKISQRVAGSSNKTGWMLLVHPDFLWNTPLAKTIGKYNYFDYSANEALFLSKKEESTALNIIENIKQEYQSNIDDFSQNIIISQLETLLNYSERFYQRQFITRKISNHQVLDKLETLLNDYFKSNELTTNGAPTVQFVSDQLNLSPGYLSNVLKLLTGKSTQQHIQEKLVALAKEKLSTTNLTVSEIAYELGFEYPQSFSKLFKTKTQLSPLEFRRSFN
ncbi:helix-turn-helix domain-containing protein [Fulvivirga ligni]|uniref:helix-turn-helix domain-containing protein n=1 Tax=Fulvivirga ligni TaxID=2904246 RepID=UPI001F2954BF|nr:helix-turn-helix domain-containing protein [Fulvivirga ligni]UII19874.1 AraC family transcriptional regulator [Fulvivirga ligni]